MLSFQSFERAVAKKMLQGAAEYGFSGSVAPSREITGDPRFRRYRFRRLRPYPGFEQRLTNAMVSARDKLDVGPLENIVDR